MPVVAPKIKVVRVVQQGIAPPPIIINPSTGQPYPRSGPYVDLGIIRVADVARAGRISLIPHSPGRFVMGVFFSVAGFEKPTNTYGGIMFTTPNTGIGGTGVALFSTTIVYGIYDTPGLQASADATALDDSNGLLAIGLTNNYIKDITPLAAVIKTGDAAVGPVSVRAPNSAYAVGQLILDTNDHLQIVQTGGVSGIEQTSEITWNAVGGTTSDGSVTWLDKGLLDGAVQAFAEIAEFADAPFILPTQIEFVVQPSNTAAGATITPPIQVKLTDQNGQPVRVFASQFRIAILGAGTLNGTTVVGIDPATGIVTWNDLSITEPGAGYVLIVMPMDTLVPAINSTPFNIT